MDTFTSSYIRTALWASCDDDGEPLDGLYTVNDIAAATIADMIADCKDFKQAHGDDIAGREARAGHDFWLTRNRHGAGFWDGDWPAEVGRRLTEASHAYGEVTLFANDDGLVYAL